MQLDVNGRMIDVPDGDGQSLLGLLRDKLGLNGTKEACSRGECGACTVLVDGRPVMSCILPVGMVRGKVETIEGLEEESEELREAFAEAGGFQCGYCTPGQVVRGVALVREGKALDEAALRRAISGNICRCTGYNGIVSALQRVLKDPSGDQRVNE